MNQATLAWAAFKNMLRAAARDPVWALISVILSPLRGGRYLLQVGAFIPHSPSKSLISLS